MKRIRIERDLADLVMGMRKERAIEEAKAARDEERRAAKERQNTKARKALVKAFERLEHLRKIHGKTCKCPWCKKAFLEYRSVVNNV
jgi:hypothetical protein